MQFRQLYDRLSSIIFKKSALDRGLFCSSYYRTYIEYIDENENFEIPDISIRKSGNNYNYLEKNGFDLAEKIKFPFTEWEDRIYLNSLKK